MCLALAFRARTCRGGGTEGVAQEIKAAALSASKALVRRGPPWAHPPHSKYFSGNRVPNSFGLDDAHALTVTFHSRSKLFMVPVLSSFRRASMAQPEPRASTGWDVNNHEIGLKQ